MRFMSWALPVAVLGIFFATTDVRADEEEIPLSKVPAAVMDAVKAKFPTATIKKAAKEEEDGKVEYEVSIVNAGKKIDVVASPNGKILAVETEIKASDLPAAVKTALDAKYPKAEYEKVEMIEEDGKTFYEVELEAANDKDYEVKLDPTGKIVSTEEKKEDDKDDKDEKKKD